MLADKSAVCLVDEIIVGAVDHVDARVVIFQSLGRHATKGDHVEGSSTVVHRDLNWNDLAHTWNAFNG